MDKLKPILFHNLFKANIFVFVALSLFFNFAFVNRIPNFIFWHSFEMLIDNVFATPFSKSETFIFKSFGRELWKYHSWDFGRRRYNYLSLLLNYSNLLEMKILCKEFPFCKYTSPTLLQEGTAFGANFCRTNNVTYKSFLTWSSKSLEK